MLFKATEIPQLKSALKALAKIYDTCNIEVRMGKITFENLAGDETEMASLKYPCEDEDCKISVGLKELINVISQTGKTETTLRIREEGVEISSENGTFNIRKVGSGPEVRNVNLNETCRFRVDTKEIIEKIQHLTPLGADYFNIKCVDNRYIYLFSKSQYGESNASLDMSDSAGEGECNYAIKPILGFLKTVKNWNTVSISFANDKPIAMELRKTGQEGEISYMRAPRIEN